jgi:hypothetical protein
VNTEHLQGFGCGRIVCPDPDLVNVGLGAHHPVEGEIYQIMPMDLSLQDVIPSQSLATSMAFDT